MVGRFKQWFWVSTSRYQSFPLQRFLHHSAAVEVMRCESSPNIHLNEMNPHLDVEGPWGGMDMNQLRQEVLFNWIDRCVAHLFWWLPRNWHRISGPVLDGGMSDPLQQLRQRCVLLTTAAYPAPQGIQARVRLKQEVGGWGMLRHFLGVFFPDVYILCIYIIYMCDLQIRYAFWILLAHCFDFAKVSSFGFGGTNAHAMPCAQMLLIAQLHTWTWQVFRGEHGMKYAVFFFFQSFWRGLNKLWLR